MNTSKLADIAEITSSIAILITLVFLVVQMQQNTEAIQADGRQTVLAADRDSLLLLTDDPGLQLNWFNPDMTDEQKLQAHYLLVALMGNRELAWLQYQNGVLDEATWITHRSPIANILASQSARTWWRHASIAIFDSNFVANIDEMLANQPALDKHPVLAWFD